MERYLKNRIKRFLNRQIRKRIRKAPLFVLVILLLSLGMYTQGYLQDVKELLFKGVSVKAENSSATADGNASVHFIDVVQGDATLIQTQSKNILVDTGEDSMQEELLKYLQGVGVDRLEYLILTHPDADHIGNASIILQQIPVEKVLMPDISTDTLCYLNTINIIRDKNIVVNYPAVGQVYQVDDINITVLAPHEEMLKTGNTNDASIGIKMVHGSNSYVMCGDAGAASEKLMTQSGIDIEADVLKCGHHGSSTSTSEQFLRQVNPTYAVISCGKENKYGHPHQEVLSRLQEDDVQIYRTDEMGTIVAEDDGNTVKWSSERP